jgi:L-proline dehydrogenase (EC 1.5.99.8)/delta-1-pyrroline-5-carboxylate dehydrogenase (EC 1.5.1.12)
LTTEAVETSRFSQKILNFANPDSVAGQLAATTVAPAVETLAQKYIAGENIPKVIRTLEQLRKDKNGVYC